MFNRKNVRPVVLATATLLSATALVSVGKVHEVAAADPSPTATEEEQKGKIRPGRKNVDLQVYGHVNQAFLFARGAGDASRTDIVDNDNSASRFGLRGQYNFGDWFSGVRLEFNAERNTTDELTFDTDSDNGTEAGSGDGEDDFLSVRRVHWNVGSKAFGNLTVGFAQTATEGITERDLSGTTLISESDIDDIGGELQFGNGIFDTLGTDFEVDDFFNNLDGARSPTITYDLPKFAIGPGALKITVSGRVEDDDGAGDDEDDDGTLSGAFEDGVQFLPSVAAVYQAEFDGFEIDTGIGYRREKDISVGDFAVNSNVFLGSLSVLAANGTNFTVGGGVQTFSEDDDQGATGDLDPGNENFVFVKAGHRFDAFSFGKTSVSIDGFWGKQIEDLGGGGSPVATEINADVDALSFGGGIVQEVKPLGAEFYAGARYYSVDIEDFRNTDGSALSAAQTDGIATQGLTDLDGIFVFFTGARIRF